MPLSRIHCWFAVSLVLAACAAKNESREIPIVNASFEVKADADGGIPGWTLFQHAGVPAYVASIDETTHADGHASARVTRTREQVFGSLAQTVQVTGLAGKTVELSAMLKTQDVTDGGWRLQLVQNSAGIAPAISHNYMGTSDFTLVSVRTQIAAATTEVEISASLQGGGTAWIDAVHLRVVDP